MGQPSHIHIQNLARAGIATHVIFDDNLVDPVFAMAKARDMPDVHFAALFENDTLVLGCPNGVPAELSMLAKPIVLNDPPAAATPPRGTENAVGPANLIERRAQPISTSALSSGVLDAIQSLTAALSNHATTQVDALNTLTKTIQAGAGGQSDLTEMKYVLQSMQEDMAHLTARARAPVEPTAQ